MLNFDYVNQTRVVFGKDTQHSIGELLKPFGVKVLLHYGGGSIVRSGLYDQVTASLNSAGVPYVALGGVVPNPRLELVHEGVALARKENVGLILAVGGGSAIDSAKAIAMGFYYEGDVWELYNTGKRCEKALPVATILTIPAAGSENSTSTVITNEATGRKYGYGSPLVRPVLSILNPELFATLPKDQIANGVSDMMSHIMERYFTDTPATDLTDGLCETTLRTIIKHAPRLLEDPRDYDAWCQVGFGGMIAHNDLLGLGRAQDWACHMMEHELSAAYDVAHGAGLSVMTPAWMEYVWRDNPTLFTQFSVNVMGVPGGLRDSESIVREGIARLVGFYRRMGLPVKLSELGIDGARLEEMAKKCTRITFGAELPRGGFKKLYWQDVLKIYELAK